MRFLPTTMLLILASAAVSGCGWLAGDDGVFRDRSDDYRKARAIPPMKIPEGSNSEAIGDLYVIPVDQTDVLLGKEFEVPRPAPLVGDPEQNLVRIQKLGEQQWILLDKAPSEVWPRVRTFLISNHIGIEREDATTGQMETAWLTFKSDTTQREKYRYRVEQGVQRSSTEIYVQQLGYTKREGEEPAAPDWKPGSMDPERETWMVKQLAEYLADTGDDSSVSLLAQGISTVNKVDLVRSADNLPAIDLRLPYERAWASLGRALEHAEFTVRDRDHDAGVYFVKYEPGKKKDTDSGLGASDAVEKKDGFFSGLFKWWGDDEENNPAIGRDYRVEMKNAADGVLIDVRRDDGKPFEEGEAEFLLGLIKAHLA